MVLQYIPVNFFGYDKEGCPSLYLIIKFCHYTRFVKILVIIFCPGDSDLGGLLHCIDARDFKRVLMVLLERYLLLAKKNNLQQLTIIMDFDNFSIKPYLSKFGKYVDFLILCIVLKNT